MTTNSYDKCAIARETDEYLTPETWTTDSLLQTWEGFQTGDEQDEVVYLQEHGTQGRYAVCLVGSLIRACVVHVPDFDYEDVEHHALVQDLAEVMANIIEPHRQSTAFGTITNFNDQDEYEEGDEEGDEEPVDRFPKIKAVTAAFAEKVCNPEA
jgi:hypothetical protein